MATGQARVGVSDVDLVTFGLDPACTRAIGSALSARHGELTSGVSVGSWSLVDLGDDEAGYASQVFLRHHCLHRGGPDISSELPRFRGDGRRWAQGNPSMGDDLGLLLSLGDGPSPEQVAQLPRLLDEVVPRVVEQFSGTIGLWS